MDKRRNLWIAGGALALVAVLLVVLLSGGQEAEVEQPATAAAQQVADPPRTAAAPAVTAESISIPRENPGPAAAGPDLPPAVDSAPTTAPLPVPPPAAASLVTEEEEEQESESPGVSILVREEQGGPLENAFVGLRRGNERRPASSARTEADGKVLIEGVDPGEYSVVVQWGSGPWHDGGTIRVRETLTEETVLYPARTRFRIQLVDPEGTPVPNDRLEVALAGGRGNWGRGDEWEGYVTDGDGFFEVPGYGTTRFFLVRSDSAAIYSAEFDDDWGNPYRFRRTFDAERTGVLIKREDVVEAIGTVVGLPATLPGLRELEVSVRSAEYDYNNLDMVGGQFRFLGAVGSEVTVNFTRGTERRNRERIPALLEKSETVRLPDRPGRFEFEITFDDRRTVGGIVITPMREPVEGIIVFGETPNPGGPGTLRFFSTRTGEDGVFLMELPRSSAYAFLPVRQTMPEEYQGRSPVERSWAELETGDPLEIVLEASSLVWGSVVTIDGQPAPNAVITLQGDGVFWNSWQISARSDEQGFFILNIPPVAATEYAEQGVTENSYVLALDFQRGVGYATAVIDNPDVPADIVLEPFVDTHLYVVAGGAPASDVRVVPQYHVPWRSEPFRPGMRPQTPNPGEPYVVPNLPRGMGSIIVMGTAPDGSEHSKVVAIPGDAQPGRMDVTVDLLGGITIH